MFYWFHSFWDKSREILSKAFRNKIILGLTIYARLQDVETHIWACPCSNLSTSGCPASCSTYNHCGSAALRKGVHTLPSTRYTHSTSHKILQKIQGAGIIRHTGAHTHTHTQVSISCLPHITLIALHTVTCENTGCWNYIPHRSTYTVYAMPSTRCIHSTSYRVLQ